MSTKTDFRMIKTGQGGERCTWRAGQWRLKREVAEGRQKGNREGDSPEKNERSKQIIKNKNQQERGRMDTETWTEIAAEFDRCQLGSSSETLLPK